MEVALERFHTGQTLRHNALLHFGRDAVTEDLAARFAHDNGRQTIEAGIKEGKQVFHLHCLKVRSEPAIFLQEHGVVFAANFIRWATHWLAQRPQPDEQALDVRQLGIKRQVRVGAHVSAHISQSSEGKLFKVHRLECLCGPGAASSAKPCPPGAQKNAQNMAVFCASASDAQMLRYGADLRRFMAWLEEHAGRAFQPDLVQPEHLRAYREYLQRDRGRKPTSIARQLAALSQFFQWAMEQGICTSNPVAQIKIPRQQRLAPRWLSRKEQRALLRVVERDLFLAHTFYTRRQVTRRRDAAMVLLLFHTGLRVGELVHLQLEDLDLKGRSGWLEVRAGKGRKSRTVPLNAAARQALQAWLQVRPETPSRFVFVVVERQHHGPISIRSVQRAIARYGRLAGLAHLTPHTLRHTFAKNLVDAGVSLEKIAALLGHSNLNTTRIYITPNFADLQQAVESLAR